MQGSDIHRGGRCLAGCRALGGARVWGFSRQRLLNPQPHTGVAVERGPRANAADRSFPVVLVGATDGWESPCCAPFEVRAGHVACARERADAQNYGVRLYAATAFGTRMPFEFLIVGLTWADEGRAGVRLVCPV